MSSSVLYRKYRPKNFKEVLGQEHIITVLEGALKQNNIAHAYLFSGSRGTGKTSIARILAREVGCSDKDLYEIDAASNRGIDDIRELREAVNVLPFESTYKVYIIDEVHMLTKEAFNALLKTLEEPPKHVLFILATTEQNKLPETIVSRCQSFVFKKPSQKILKDMIARVAKKEGFTLESSAADLIALLGDGSFRDVLGILQKILTSSNDKVISVTEVEKVTGAPKGVLVNNYITAIDESNIELGLVAVNAALKENVDMKVFLTLILRTMRAILLLRYAPEMRELIKEEFGNDDFEYLQRMSNKKSTQKTNDSKSGIETQINAKALKVLLSAYNDIGYAALPQLPLELALIELCKK